eukprot:GHVQ01035670.1.p1 GENE.GHVQ01035670.1~~GHVQ01035670.1.p1  ORF type:complete len:451 (-),score=65.84 GHVQ01035670.1:438-1790(-)
MFAHEYTYQGCAYDFLDIPVCGGSGTCAEVAAQESGPGGGGNRAMELTNTADNTFEYTITNNLGKEEQRKAVLGESDELWVRFRHQHIDWVTRTVNAEVQKFINENAAAKLQRNKTLSSDEAMLAIRSLPQYQDMLAKYWTHVTMSAKCHDALKCNRILEGVGTLEQDLCCGVDMDGSEVSSSKLLSALGWLLSDPHVEMEPKLRLVLLYFTQLAGVGELERRKIIEAAQVSLDCQRCILAFLRMELHLADEAVASSAPTSKPKHRLLDASGGGDKDRLKYNKQRAKTADKELSRFEPNIKQIMIKAVSGSLHGGQFPYVEDPSSRKAKQPTKTVSSSLRGGVIGKSTQWDWGTISESTGSFSAQQEQFQKSSSSGGGAGGSGGGGVPGGAASRLIVFVVGGMTFAETRSAYEVCRETKADVIIGGSAVLTPSRLISMLKQQAAATARLI